MNKKKCLETIKKALDELSGKFEGFIFIPSSDISHSVCVLNLTNEEIFSLIHSLHHSVHVHNKTGEA